MLKHGLLMPIGATIRCRDGQAGRLKKVVIDPEDGAVTYLIVERGQLLRRDVVVPVGWVESTSEREIVLNATEAELNAQPRFDELFFIKPEIKYKPADGYRREDVRFWKSPYELAGGGSTWIAYLTHYGFRSDNLLVDRGLPVVTKDEREVGSIDHLVVDSATGRVVQFVVSRSRFRNRKARIVPLERVASVSGGGVILDMTAEEFERLPEYQPPAGDDQISSELQRALDTDPRTRGAGLRVDIHNGVVRLIGLVTEEVKDAARAIARRIRGVTGFSDDPFAPPSPPLWIGEPVITRDSRYGTLRKVVVDPYACRVTHLVVRRDKSSDDERVIPIERVEHVELEGIYLDVAVFELDDFPRYRDENFVQPLENWEALEPYAAADSLFWSGPFIGVAPSALPVVELVVHVGVPENAIAMQQGADVVYEGETVGTVDRMLIDPHSGAMTHLVVEEKEHGRKVIVPSHWIQELYENRILLNHWEPEPRGVPARENRRDDAAAAEATDDDIAADLSARLHAYPELGAVQVQVKHGKVRLVGTVQKDADKAAAEAIVRGAPGVVDVDNDLTNDRGLCELVSKRVAAFMGVEKPPFEIIVDYGVVALKGAVPAKEYRAMIEAIVSNIPGVAGILNELEVGQKTRDELIDEALEETFPASDSPAPYHKS